MKIKFINFDDMFDSNKVIKDFNLFEDDNFSKFGLFSEEIFKDGSIGWIDLGNHYIINPVFYNFLNKICPMAKILEIKNSIDEDGNDVFSPEEKKNFHHVGMNYFIDNCETIIDYYIKKKPDKAHYKQFFEQNQDYLITNKILVINTRNRPAMLINGKFEYDKINTYYIAILNNLKQIQENDFLSKKITENCLYKIQEKMKEIYKYIINDISGKEGLLRKNLFGYRINFSARNIIVPASDKYSIDECVISYNTFMIIYKFVIMHYLQKINNLSFLEVGAKRYTEI